MLLSTNNTTLKVIFATFFCTVILLGQVSFKVAAEDETVDDEDRAKSADSSPPEENQNESGLQSSIDADVTFAFTRPVIESPYQFKIGQEIHFLVGLKNKGQQDFVVKTIGASFRYALDFSYSLQNFTSGSYNQIVKPNEEATLGYTFFVSEQYLPRTYGFIVNVFYDDINNKVQYENVVFNQTITLIELDQQLDGEAFFLWLVLLGLTILAIYGISKLFNNLSNKYFGVRKTVPKPVEQERLVDKKEVDFDWLPNTVAGQIKKTSTSSK